MNRIVSLLRYSVLFVIGCGSSGSTTVDAHLADSSPLVDSAASPDGSSNACAGAYITASIASMRQGTPGCYVVTNVVTLGVTPSMKSPRLFVEDAAGGDFSAMMMRCSSASTAHPCSVATTVAALADGHSVTIQGTYIKTSASTFEEFFIDTVTDNGPTTLPPPATATLAQIARSGNAANLRFQHVKVTVGAADTLKMYDWTPSEFANTTATACAYQFGFGMIPKSVTAITPGAACTTGTTQPPGQVTPNAAEVLIGTDFFKSFTTSSDCRCAKMFMDMEPAAASTVGGTIGGLLIFDVPFGMTVGHYYLAPKTLVDFPLSGTVAGM